jgi:ribosomal protein S27AE
MQNYHHYNNKGNNMNQIHNSCPLEHTWCGDFCSLLAEHQKNDTRHLCQYQFECNQLKDSLLNDLNLSVLLTKRILVHGIPLAL